MCYIYCAYTLIFLHVLYVLCFICIFMKRIEIVIVKDAVNQFIIEPVHCCGSFEDYHLFIIICLIIFGVHFRSGQIILLAKCL